jgi:2,6-dihydroxypseudooxynicotine hydrolase
VAVGEQHEALGREALAEGRLRSGGEHLAQAAAYYHFAKFVFVEDVDQMRAAHQRAVAAYTDALPHLDPPGRRVEIPFENATLVAVVRTPAGDGPFPVVLMIPGLDSTKEEIRSTEQTFLDRGLATFSVDGPGQGEAEYDLKIRGDWGPVTEVLYDAIGEQPDLDRERLGVWGVSLGGYYSVRVMAALGARATAGVSLAGPFNFGECWDGLPPLTRDTFRVRSGTASDEDARAVANTLDLSQVAGDVAAPMLLVFGKQDRLIPFQQAEKAHAAVPGSELLMLEEANHGCADYSPWHRPRTADWLAHHLGGDVGDPGVTADAHVKAGV